MVNKLTIRYALNFDTHCMVVFGHKLHALKVNKNIQICLHFPYFFKQVRASLQREVNIALKMVTPIQLS